MPSVDHGLYRTLTDSFRLDYAHLWSALLVGDESGIEEYSYRLFTQAERVQENGIDHHRLFASMLTGRTWDVISNSSAAPGGGLSTSRTKTEDHTFKSKVGSGRFLVAVAGILAKLPRELLLLLKTNDLLRAVDDKLGVSTGATDHMLRMVAVMGWYCAIAIRRETVREMRKERAERWTDGDILMLPLWFEVDFWRCQMRYWGGWVEVAGFGGCDDF